MGFPTGRSVLFALCVLGGTIVLQAGEGLPPPMEPSVSEPDTPDFLKPQSAPSFPVVRVIVTLSLLLGALYFVKPLLQKTKWGGASGGTGLDVLGRASLGPRAGICLVRAEGRKFLLGVGADGVRLLAELGDGTSLENPPSVLPHDL
ncbi:MAG: flagellar biosynthetic protein FliO [Elusimicrobia bacterium]|nr:flagellar biosynthetic protein FliO [Elusimicrobiota bacterium]